MSKMHRWLTFVTIGLTLFFVGEWLNGMLKRPPPIGLDFAEFYCAGEAVLQHADPYRVEPLRTCLHRVQPPAPNENWAVTPAPLPGYTLAVFSAFAKLPIPVARMLWSTLLVASTLIAALALAELTGWSPVLIGLCLLPTVGLLNVYYGELTPIVVAALCVGALALERGKPWLAAVCAGIAMIEPHIGLPALGALLLIVPRARPWACGVTAALVAISLLAIRLGLNVDYFWSVLPLQALAEVVANDQYSLTHLLAMLGVSPATAIFAGSASYVVMAGLGIMLAAYLSSRRLAYVMILPPAVVTLGGSFIHDIQIAVALPAALLLASSIPTLRRWAIIAAMLLVVQIGFHGFMVYVSLASLLALIVLAWMLPVRGLLSRVLTVAGSVLVVANAGILLWLLPHHHSASTTLQRVPPIAISSNDYAPTVWGAYLRSRPEVSQPSARTIVEKIPAWLGLCILIGCAMRTSRRQATVPAAASFHLIPREQLEQ
jgi:hypothetical protein